MAHRTPEPSAAPAPLLSQRAPQALALLRRGQRRLWLQRAVQRLARGLALPLLAAAAAIAATRGLWLAERFDLAVDLILAALFAAPLAWAAAQRQPLLAVARRLDRASAGSDTLATAVDLAAAGRGDGWALVQAKHAEQHAQGLRVQALLPWSLPRGWRASAAAALGLALAAAPSLWTPLQRGSLQPAAAIAVALPPRPDGFVSARQELGEDQAQLLSVDARLLGEIEEQLSDPATRQWIGDLRKVVEAVQQGHIDKRQALEQLAALEAARPHRPELDAALQDAARSAPAGQSADRDAAEAERQRDLAARNAVLEATKKALDAAPDGEDKAALEKALAEGDLGLVAKALQKLAEKDLQPKDIEKWRKTLEKFADALKDARVPKGMEELAKRIARLEQQRAAQGGLNPSDQRRLQEARRDLQQLQREHGDAEAARHQVQRLERQARQAADELRRAAEGPSRFDKAKGGGQGQQGQEGQRGAQGQQGGGGQQALREAMRQAADELRRQDEGQKSRQAQRIGESRMRDLREALSRGEGRRGQGEPQGEQGQGRQAEGKSRLKPGAKGQDGQDQHNSGDDPDRDPQGQGQGQGQRAAQGEAQGQGQGSGRSGQSRSFRLGSKGLGDKSRTELINEGYEQRQAQRGGRGAGSDGGQPGEGSQAGSERGSEQGKGKKIALDAARTEQVRGQQGSGPDVKQTFLDAARKGFARQGWREVYAEYSQVAEEMLDKEGLPAGRKALVRRYFEKIRPR